MNEVSESITPVQHALFDRAASVFLDLGSQNPMIIFPFMSLLREPETVESWDCGPLLADESGGFAVLGSWKEIQVLVRATSGGRTLSATATCDGVFQKQPYYVPVFGAEVDYCQSKTPGDYGILNLVKERLSPKSPEQYVWWMSLDELTAVSSFIRSEIPRFNLNPWLAEQIEQAAKYPSVSIQFDPARFGPTPKAQTPTSASFLSNRDRRNGIVISELELPMIVGFLGTVTNQSGFDRIG